MSKSMTAEMPARTRREMQEAANGQVQPAITWLNLSGDTTITWDEADREAVMAMVEQKMREGYVFLVLEPVPLVPIFKRKKRIYSAAELAGVRKVIQQGPPQGPDLRQLFNHLNDAQLADLVSKGQAQLAQRAATEKKGVRRAHTPEEVVRQQTVAIRPIAGG